MPSSNLLERLRTYKAEQGRYVRLSAFWSLTLLWLYGCFRFYEQLRDLRFEWAAFLRHNLIEEIPLLEVPFPMAALVGILVFLAGAAGFQMFLNKPNVADLLIDTEAELRKVTWPTIRDTTSASIVVLITVLVVFILLGVFDFVLGRAITFLLFTH